MKKIPLKVLQKVLSQYEEAAMHGSLDLIPRQLRFYVKRGLCWAIKEQLGSHTAEALSIYKTLEGYGQHLDTYRPIHVHLEGSYWFPHFDPATGEGELTSDIKKCIVPRLKIIRQMVKDSLKEKNRISNEKI